MRSSRLEGNVHLDGVGVVRHGRTVLDGVDVEIGTGITVIVGANGAGKSTLLSVIATLLEADRGSVRVGGIDVADRRGRRLARGSIGYLGQAGSLPRQCTVEESVAYPAWLQRVGGARSEAVDRALTAVDLQAHRSEPLGRLSGGTLQRARLAQAIVHEPAVLLLDEPTVALDLVHARELRGHIERIGSDRCVVMTSHLVEDVERFGDRVLIVRDGGLAFDGTSAELIGPGPKQPSLGEALAATVSGGDRCS